MNETKRELHPSVVEFKQFVKAHPKLIEEVRTQQKTWKELYEDWYLFGAEDSMWDAYRQEEAKSETATEEKKDIMSTIVSSLKNMDLNQVQYHITNVNSAIANIQQVLQQFQSTKPANRGAQSRPGNPFGFRKD
ncbi:cytosolic protein [Priestia megaterium]|nr:cytosolic protein [Priestia megaterium]